MAACDGKGSLLVVTLFSVICFAYLFGSKSLSFVSVGRITGGSTDHVAFQREDSAAQSGQDDSCDSCNQTPGITPSLTSPTMPQKLRRCTKKLPKAIVIGVKKCGTGAMKFYMRHHPSIACPTGRIDFFSQLDYKQDLETYREKMTCSRPGQLTMEGSPPYFVTKEAPQRIHEALPGVKLILLLRDPVSRAVSDYVHTIVKGHFLGQSRAPAETSDQPDIMMKYECLSSFEESVLYRNGSLKTWNQVLVLGRYASFLPRWLEYFPLQRMLILDGNAFAKDPVPTLRQVEEFLEIPSYFTRSHFKFNEQRGFFCLNKPKPNICPTKGKGRPHPKINETIVGTLQDYFEPFNKQLNAMLNRTFPWST